MKTCTLRHRGGIIQDHHPETINRFVQDPEHGLLAFVFGDTGLKACPLEMTIEEAREAFEKATSIALPAQESVRISKIAIQAAELSRLIAGLREDQITEGITLRNDIAMVRRQIEDPVSGVDRSPASPREFLKQVGQEIVSIKERFDKLLFYLGVESDWENQVDTDNVAIGCLPGIKKSYSMVDAAINERIGALANHLGLVEGWEDGMGGELVSGCIPSLRANIGAVADTIGRLVGYLGVKPTWGDDLRASKTLSLDIPKRIDQLELSRFKHESYADSLSLAEKNTRTNHELLVSLAGRLKSVEEEVPGIASRSYQANERLDSLEEWRGQVSDQGVLVINSSAAPDFWIPPAPGGEAARGWVKIGGEFTTKVPIIARWGDGDCGARHIAFDAGDLVDKGYIGEEYMEIPQ